MDAIRILSGIILFLSLAGNMTGAKKGLKAAVSQYKEKPKSYLQKVPPNISASILLLIVLGIFNIGTISINEKYLIYNVIGLILFALGSFLQVHSFKTMGNNYSQEIIIFNKHQLVTSGIYKIIRHPQYLFQIISDLGAGIALGSYLIVPIVIILEIPLFVKRAYLEEKLLAKYFLDEYEKYKSKVGFMLPKWGK
ncbi:MAG TPA: isoprenylcysteine carboxylmethyltransferase family protein [Melioribacteraceae bacterium]|nr:isoprenylcysteine carboxylmethyltransferase family protein [Melioribacteraceae bacterium]